jgi:GNAT superfamily N-acetyltransferase
MMAAGIRRAVPDDAAAIVDLAERRRVEYQGYQPVFWRKAADSRERHLPYIARLLGSAEAIALVHEGGEALAGFVIATLMTAPPVYDPGGPVCLIDDFAVAAAAAWETVGLGLLRAATAAAKERGAVLAVVVCGHLDEPKRAMLRAAGYGVASEWYVSEI